MRIITILLLLLEEEEEEEEENIYYANADVRRRRTMFTVSVLPRVLLLPNTTDSIWNTSKYTAADAGNYTTANATTFITPTQHQHLVNILLLMLVTTLLRLPSRVFYP